MFSVEKKPESDQWGAARKMPLLFDTAPYPGLPRGGGVAGPGGGGGVYNPKRYNLMAFYTVFKMKFSPFSFPFLFLSPKSSFSFLPQRPFPPA